MAERIAIIDHGVIVARGTTTELCEQTNTKSLEAAYLKLTGETLRDELGNNDGLNARMARRNHNLR